VTRTRRITQPVIFTVVAGLSGSTLADPLTPDEPFAKEVRVTANVPQGSISGPQGVAIGDLDGDGDADLAIANQASDNLSILLGDGDGGFTFFQNIALNFQPGNDKPLSVAIGDLNGDGVPDLAVALVNSGQGGQVTDSVAVLLGNSMGPFGYAAPQTYGVANAPTSVILVDIAGNDALDIVTANQSPGGSVSLLVNDGAGGFPSQAFDSLTGAAEAETVVTGLFDDDMVPDLAVVHEAAGNISVLVRKDVGNGTWDGTFSRPVDPTDYPVGASGSGIATGDVNSDGILDLVATAQQDDLVAIYLGDDNGMGSGDGTFTFEASLSTIAGPPSTGDAPDFVELADFDADGYLDIATVNSTSGDVTIFFNLGGVSSSWLGFEPIPIAMDVGAAPSFHAAGDVDSDGSPDIIATNNNSNDISILINNAVATTTWTGAGNLFDVASNWSLGTPNLVGPTVGVFDVTLGGSPPTEIVSLGRDESTLALLQASPEVELLLSGHDLSITGDTLPDGASIGLALGVEQCDLVEPLPITPPVFRINNNDGDGNLIGPPGSLVTRTLTVGAAGPATLEITSGNELSRLWVTERAVIGDQGDGSVRLETADSLLEYGEAISPPIARMIIGDSATGEIDVAAGRVAAPNEIDSLVLGHSATGRGTLLIRAPAPDPITTPTWDHRSRDFVVGDLGDGVVEIQNGAWLRTSVGNGVTLARGEGSSATIHITGSGSRWSANGEIRVGGEGAANIVVESGARLEPVILTNTASGTVSGDGSILSSGSAGGDRFISFGDVSPGGSTGPALTVQGDYEQFDDPANPALAGRLILELSGDSADPVSTRLIVEGTAELEGALVVQSAAGFDPRTNPNALDGLALVTASAGITGRFDAALFPGLGAQGRFLRAQVSGGGGALFDGSGAGVSAVTLVVDTLTGDIDVGDPSAFSVNGAPRGATLADATGDGLLDLAVVVPDELDPENAPGDLFILENAGSMGGVWQGFTGATTQIPVGVNPVGVAAADFDSQNGTSFSDFVVANQGDDTVTILLNNGAGSLSVDQTVSVPVTPMAIIAPDFDEALGRGPDIAVVGEDGGGNGQVVVRLNSGVSTGWAGLDTPQSFSVGDFPVDLRAGDMDEDKDLDDDLMIANFGSSTVTALFNQGLDMGGVWQGLGARRDAAVPSGPIALAIGDLDNQLGRDVAVTSQSTGEFSVLLNQGGGSFSPSADLPAGDSARSVALADLDDDGDLDAALVVDDAGTGDRLVRILRNDLTADGLAFAPAEDVSTGAEPILVLSDDVDGVSGPDVVAVNDQTGGGSGSSSALGPMMDNDVSVLLTPIPCTADLDGDGHVSSSDLALLLGSWGSPGPADLDGSGAVGSADLALLLGAWGACQ